MNAGEFGKTLLLFLFSAAAEILGCYFLYLWLRKAASPWMLPCAALALFVFAWSLSLHPAPAGRVYAAYGGVYVVLSLIWFWMVDGAKIRATDLIGVVTVFAGILILRAGGRTP
ncbi:MAG: YnfA family protein [Leptospirales bacterium]|nr:YnfA family protein [Leptospirales bacterium]